MQDRSSSFIISSRHEEAARRAADIRREADETFAVAARTVDRIGNISVALALATLGAMAARVAWAIASGSFPA